jgi:4-diphosphocytidyl-2-C-methyl-D-erythritol kinase|tara:strand:- start:6 stop:851 length:846 start_codon:yes stop_codon:yes gene_type:complete
MTTFKIKSYAKINLALNVIRKTSKLHKIESIVCFIDLYDLIYLKLVNKRDHEVSFQGKFSKGISKKNTVTTLLKLLDQKKLLNNKKLKIKIIKNIPQKAGMGGGSMNAASLINFLIFKKILKVKNNELIKLTKLIGSDVILGIGLKNTILSSNGLIKRYKKKIKFYTLIVKPNFGCSTKFIFSKVKSFSRAKFNLPSKLMLNKDYLKNLNNDLEIVAFRKYSKLKNIKLFLSSLPNVIFVRMSGSGSSIVAYFHSKNACKVALKQFKSKFNSYWCIASKTI